MACQGNPCNEHNSTNTGNNSFIIIIVLYKKISYLKKA